jgi:ubiquinone/menaquinone biosynthesis C-methylase UbiE
MIEKAEANSASHMNVHFRKSNVEELPFEDEFFDFIICSNAFHHFSNPEKTLREAYRVLKPKGRIYILDPTADGLFMKMVDKLAAKLEPSHVKLYSTREYQTLFEKTPLHYINSKIILLTVKVHIAEKERGRGVRKKNKNDSI